MAVTPSNMLELGTQAPSFSLTDTDGKQVSLDSFSDAKGYLVMFICNHCPYVIHIREELAKMSDEYSKKGIAVFAINSNDAVSYPADNFENMKIEKQTQGYHFPYLFDETQEVAKAYDAACTPDFYLFDASKKLFYRGQLDDSRPGSSTPVTGTDLRQAMDAVLSNSPYTEDQRPSTGCNIKWKS